MAEDDSTIRAEFVDNEGKFDPVQAILFIIKRVRSIDDSITRHGGLITKQENLVNRVLRLEKWKAGVESMDTISIREKSRTWIDKITDKWFELVISGVALWVLAGPGGCPGQASADVDPVDTVQAVDVQDVGLSD